MAITHIEVLDAKAQQEIAAGQLLKVVGETPCFYKVKCHAGTILRVSKKTKRIIGGEFTFIRTNRQPICNF